MLYTTQMVSLSTFIHYSTEQILSRHFIFCDEEKFTLDEQLFFTSDKKQDIKQNNLFFSWLLNIYNMKMKEHKLLK